MFFLTATIQKVSLNLARKILQARGGPNLGLPLGNRNVYLLRLSVPNKSTSTLKNNLKSVQREFVPELAMNKPFIDSWNMVVRDNDCIWAFV